MKYQKIQKPVDSEERICFGLIWYDTEQEAQTAAKIIHKNGDRYNGGMLDGKPCGREPRFDRQEGDIRKGKYAVTYAMTPW